MLEVKRIEPILADMKATLPRIPLIAHLNSCRKLIENGWIDECDSIPHLQPLKPYFNDPLSTILAKLFLLKFLYVAHKNNPRNPADETNWIVEMRKNLIAQFSTVCSQANQQVMYNGKHIHTLEDLETLAQQRSGPRPVIDSPALMNQETALDCFKVICLLNAAHMSTRYLDLYPIAPTQYAITAGFFLMATLFFGTELIKRGPHINYNLSVEAVQNNLMIQKDFLISVAELNRLNDQQNGIFIAAESLVIGAILNQFRQAEITNPGVIAIWLPTIMYGFATLLKKIPPVSALLYDRFFPTEQHAQRRPAQAVAAQGVEEIIDEVYDQPRRQQQTNPAQKGK